MIVLVLLRQKLHNGPFDVLELHSYIALAKIIALCLYMASEGKVVLMFFQVWETSSADDVFSWAIHGLEIVKLWFIKNTANDFVL